MKPPQAATETAITPAQQEDAESQTAVGQSTPTPTPTPAKSSDLDGLTEGQSADDAQKSAALSKSKKNVENGTPRPDWPASDARRVPRIPGYRILSELGRGTFGEVWLAEDEITGVKVAIKFLCRNLGHQWQMLQAEVKQLAMFQEDPGIVQLRDFEPDGERPYYVMAYAEGGSLAQRLLEGPMTLAEALPMFRRIAEAMAYVHARGIRHCDLKPGNILLDARGRPRVADFGQAHFASDMSPKLGTFFYMAPEQADLEHHVPGSRWDVYGLGALFYAMITGKPPHEDSTLREKLESTERVGNRLKVYREAMERAKQLRAHRDVAGMDSQLAQIIDRCLAVDPAKRYPTAEGIVSALNERERRKREKPILIAGLAVPLLLLLVLGLFAYVEANSAIKKSRENLEKQAKEHFKVSADLAAAKVKKSVEDYFERIVKHASSPILVQALQTPPKGEINEKIKGSLKELFYAMKASDGVLGSCCLFDAQGFLVGIYSLQASDENLVRDRYNFAWRDYFQGDSDQWADKPALGMVPKRPFAPIQKPTISHPYESVDERKSICFGLSTPVRDDEDRVVGVLMANLYVEKLNEWLTDVEIPDGLAALVDQRYHVLHHAEELKTIWRPVKGNNPRPFEEYKRVFPKSSSSVGALLLPDPVNGKDYLAGYKSIDIKASGITAGRMAVLVQVLHAKIIEPTEDLQSELIRWGAIMLTLALLLVIAMWFGLLWLMRRETRLARV